MKVSPVKKISKIKRKTTILSNDTLNFRGDSVLENVAKIKSKVRERIIEKLQRGETSITNNLRFHSRLMEKNDSNPINFGAMKNLMHNKSESSPSPVKAFKPDVAGALEKKINVLFIFHFLEKNINT